MIQDFQLNLHTVDFKQEWDYIFGLLKSFYGFKIVNNNLDYLCPSRF